MATAYDWQGLYEAAVFETDFQKIQNRVAEAREAIQQRLAEGLSRENDATELRAIDSALAALAVLETESPPQKASNDQRPNSTENHAASQTLETWCSPPRDLPS